MSQPNALDATTVADRSADTHALDNAQQLSANTQHPGEIKVADGNLSSVNVDKKTSSDGNAITHFPNGVKFDSGGVAVGMEPPPGGSIGTDSKGQTVLFDKNHKQVAELDADKTIHVHTKNGDYTETKDGQVSFTPKGAVSDLSTLHKPGAISPAKMEDYGLSSAGSVTRFPNGIEYDKSSNKVIIPSEHPGWHENTTTDGQGNVTSRSGYDENGKLLYTMDGKGIHVPTADGTINESQNGSMTFDSNSTARNANHGLPKLELTDGKKKASDPLGPECAESRDPLCGLDLGKF
jgi:hypothetical protein